MSIVTFKGFGGARLEADALGDADSPPVLLLHGEGQSRSVWTVAAEALVAAGRRVVNLDLRELGRIGAAAADRFDFEADVENVRAVLAQLRGRPVVVAAGLGGWVAAIALGDEAATLATGLILVDLPGDARNGTGTEPAEQFGVAAQKIAIPMLCVRGALSDPISPQDAAAQVAQLPQAEWADMADVELSDVPGRMDALNGLLLAFLERKQPLEPPQYRSGSDPRTFREALGCFATGVTVVTTSAPDGTPIGLTANSFTSVSLDPPLLLVCVADGTKSADVLRQACHFAVNVLQIGQQPTSHRFAGKTEDRFATTPWQAGENGAPVLQGSLASFECRQYSVNDGGDHFILVGEVTKATFEPRRDPLLYFRGKYRRLHFA